MQFIATIPLPPPESGLTQGDALHSSIYSEDSSNQIKPSTGNDIDPPIVDNEITQSSAVPRQISSEDYKDGAKRFKEVRERLTPYLKKALTAKNLVLGSPVLLRSFKEERELEMWMLDQKSSKYIHVHTWPITGLSGDLGPKLAEGDRQSPEGFYQVSLPQFLPSSSYHLAFNVGYPNAFDRAHKRTGSFIMVHGSTRSIGCLAMTDPFIEEIYTTCHSALSKSQQNAFQIHMFPFRMNTTNMQKYSSSTHLSFWKNLKQGYDFFETNKLPPKIEVNGLKYVFSAP